MLKIPQHLQTLKPSNTLSHSSLDTKLNLIYSVVYIRNCSMKKFRKFISFLFVIIIGTGFVFIAGRAIGERLGFIDSSALFGGQLEFGYPSAGYLISYEPGGGFKTCGYSLINDNIGITASHCVDNSESIYLGVGDFNLNPENNVLVTRAIQKQQWVDEKQRRHDFATLVFNDDKNLFNDFAELTSPQIGCNYRVVAYGRAETDNEYGSLKRQRKSAQMCITSIENEIFFIKGFNAASGICFGDSGSPLYSNETNQVVGVIASIVLEKEDGSDPCAFGNTAIVVRADANSKIVNENIQAAQLNIPANIGVSDPVIIDIVQETFWDKIGLGHLNTEQQMQFVLLGSVSLLIVMIIIILYLLLKKPNPQKDQFDGYYLK